MDIQKETVTLKNVCKVEECHCSVCFGKINDIESATHSLAGRYYCKNCRTIFGEKAMVGFVKRDV